MKLNITAIHISFVLVLCTVSIILVADALFGLSEERMKSLFDKRKALSENLTLQSTLFIQNGDEATLADILNNAVESEPDVLSIALRDINGQFVILAGNNDNHWTDIDPEVSTVTKLQIPIFDDGSRWGTLYIRFQPTKLNNILYSFQYPFIKLLLFVALVGFAVYLLFIKGTLEYVDPSSLIPERVKNALDVLSEGIVIIDMDGRIVLANSTFANKIDKSGASLIGHKIAKLNWKIPHSEQDIFHFPWLNSLQKSQNQSNVLLNLVNTTTNEAISFNVNSSPVFDGKGNARGAIISFNDVTELKQTNKQLLVAINDLHGANKKLEKLAMRDELTGCLNRRAFFEKFDNEFKFAQETSGELCCVMIDIDYFKSINDKYGHTVGDTALKAVAKSLSSTLRTNDVICRYGGEELCVLLVGLDIDQAVSVAERMRLTVKFDSGAAIRSYADINITSSFGVSSIKFGASNPEDLVSQADKALYNSKKSGRNIVSVWQSKSVINISGYSNKVIG